MIVLILSQPGTNFVMSSIGANRMLNEFLGMQISSAFWTLMAVIGFYVILGTVMGHADDDHHRCRRSHR